MPKAILTPMLQFIFREPSGWIFLWLGLSLALLVLMGFKEWRTRESPRFPLRLLASLMVSVMLFLLGSGGSFEVKTKSRAMLILSLPEGSPESNLFLLKEAARMADSLGVENRIALLRTDRFNVDGWKNPLPQRFNPINRIEEALPFLSPQDTLYLSGNGLLSNELALLESLSTVRFLPSFKKPGFIITSGSQFIQSEISLLSGYWDASQTNNENAIPEFLTIKHPGGKLDSIFNPGGLTRIGFSQSIQIPVSGYFSFLLRAFRGNVLIGAETLHVQVNNPRKLRVLMLYQTPTFELATLKNHLASLGHEVFEQVRVSKDRTRTESINSPLGQKIEQFENFNLWDALITDPAYISSLSPNALRSLQNAISNQGLGLLVYSTSARMSQPQSLEFITAFQSKAKVENTTDEVKCSLRFSNQIGENFGAIIPDPNPNYLVRNTQPPQESLASVDLGNGISRPAAIFEPFGKGAIISLAPIETNLWLRSANLGVYNAFWSALFRRLIPIPQVSFKSKTPFATHTFPFDFSLSYAKLQNQPPKALFTSADGSFSDTVYFKQSIFNPTEFHSTIYPKHHGWHRIIPLGDSLQPLQSFLTHISKSEPLAFDFFVYQKEQWEAANSAHQINSTKLSLISRRQLEASSTSSILEPSPAPRESQPIPSEDSSLKFWQGFLLLISLTYLWLEDKLRR